MAIPTNEQVDANSPINELLMKQGFRDNLGAPIGTIHAWYDYDGALSVPPQFMLCNGDIINSTNYNVIHGSGAWTDEVGSTALDGKYTPDLNTSSNIYLAGGDATEDGTSAISTVGNSSNELDLEHLHAWHTFTIGNHPRVFNNSGSLIEIPTQTTSSGETYIATGTSTGSQTGLRNTGLYTENKLSSTQDIKPESIVVKYIIKVV